MLGCWNASVHTIKIANLPRGESRLDFYDNSQRVLEVRILATTILQLIFFIFLFLLDYHIIGWAFPFLNDGFTSCFGFKAKEVVVMIWALC